MRCSFCEVFKTGIARISRGGLIFSLIRSYKHFIHKIFAPANDGNKDYSKFKIYLSKQNRHHPKYYCEIDIPEDFIRNRLHLLESNPRRTNHDVAQLFLFKKIIELFQSPIIEICEFGTWRGSFIENILIDLPADQKINYTGYDTFKNFPKINNSIESKSIHNFDKRISLNHPFSKEELSIIFAKYASKLQYDLREGVIDKSFDENLKNADIIFFDMDYGITFSSIVAKTKFKQNVLFIVDDYHHPSWFNLTYHVNEFCRKSNRLPVNISDFFGVPRSDRTKFTYLLVPTVNRQNIPELNYQISISKNY